jgi:prevent-host-death family protein
MATVTALEAKTRFRELLDRVSRGEEIIITKDEKPVARMVPEGQPSLRRVQNAVKELRAFRQELEHRGFKPLTNKEIRQARDEGR